MAVIAQLDGHSEGKLEKAALVFALSTFLSAGRTRTTRSCSPATAAPANAVRSTAAPGSIVSKMISPSFDHVWRGTTR